jgi:hypothetical protein
MLMAFATRMTKFMLVVTVSAIMLHSRAFGQSTGGNPEISAFRLRCDTPSNAFRDWLVSLKRRIGSGIIVNDVMIRYRVILMADRFSADSEASVVQSAHELDPNCTVVRLPPIVETGRVKIPSGDLVLQFGSDLSDVMVSSILKNANLEVLTSPSPQTPGRYLVRDKDDDVARLLRSAKSLAANKAVVFAEPDTLGVLGGRSAGPL